MRLAASVCLVTMLAACSRERGAGAGRGATAPLPERQVTPAAVPHVVEQLARETEVRTASGASFQAPKQWWLTRAGDVVVLEGPDRQLKATLLETQEPDALKAIAGGVRRVQPAFAIGSAGAPKRPPPVRGWEAVTRVDYRTNREDRLVWAMARRYGGLTYVALVEAEKSAAARRGVQLETALWTLQPPGMQEESFVARAPRIFDGRAAAELRTFIEAALPALDVPGAAVAVVQGERIVFESSFGVRALGSPEPVGTQSLFMIGSLSKPLTTLLQASVVDSGRVGWDTPVTRLLPGFTLGNLELTRKLTLAHTACACSGVPRRDLEIAFEFQNVTPEQALARLSTLQPTTGFGEAFQYSNELVAAGGYAVAHLLQPDRPLGEAYDAAMRARVFDPIGMKATTLDFALASHADRALPHAEGVDGKPRPIPVALERHLLPLRPAGGIWSNARDLSRYAMTEMAGGVAPDGRRAFSQANLLERRKPRVRIADVESYGLGLVVGTFRGLPVVWHSGQTAGYSALVHMLPEQRVAVVVLTNTQSGGVFAEVVQRKVAEQIFDGKPLAAPRVDFFASSKRDRIAKLLMVTLREPDSKWLTGLIGRYENPRLGEIRVSPGAAGGGVIDAGEWRSAFARRSTADNSSRIVLLDPPLAGLIELLIGHDGAHPTLSVADEQETFVFRRAP